MLFRNILLFLTGWLAVIPCVAQPLNVVTFNVRYDNPEDGKNAWPNRKEAFTKQLLSVNPDIISLQEVLWDQLRYLKKNLHGFCYEGEGRDGGKKGEFSPVFYNKKKFRVITSKTRWLAPDSMAVGKLAWDARCTRIYTLVELQNRQSGDTFFVINTHFDHEGAEARIHSAEILRDVIKSLPSRKVIVTGDLNCTPDSEPVRLLLRNGMHDSAGKDSSITCCGFEINDPHNKRIDYIFYSGYYTPIEYRILNKTASGSYLSDHHGVFSKLEFRGE